MAGEVTVSQDSVQGIPPGREGETLPLLVSVSEQDSTMGLFSAADGEALLRHIPLDVLRENLRRTSDSLRALLGDLADSTERFRLKEAQIGVEVSAEGGIQIIGTAKVGTKANIILVFGE
ncbi:Pepco domain-containing protein [Actinomadura chokoriensis]|uniref:Pepco domain-containing protein n=1 Tax=Actinomadura chokoriensis TaxID=454156 RepID=A0ABV4R3A0_9ACTN